MMARPCTLCPMTRVSTMAGLPGTAAWADTGTTASRARTNGVSPSRIPTLLRAVMRGTLVVAAVLAPGRVSILDIAVQLGGQPLDERVHLAGAVAAQGG